ncbi:AsmA family protein [Sphingoaurantiacus capsulatus]|uniref:AsmA family protein n=1 Tax=Sphingoaurantiacus capsulatus TaxID=1771310 RepID=A0ABV7X9U7_9SPHN
MASDPTTVPAETPPPPPREKRDWRESLTWPVKLLLGILLAIFIAWLVLYITKGRFLKDTFVSIASDYTERQVRVGGDFNLYLNPFHIQFLAEDITVSNPAWAKDKQLFDADRVALQLNIWRLIFGQRRFNYLDLQGAEIGLERQETRNTWTFRSDSNEPFELPDIVRAAITGTRIHYIDRPLALDANIAVGDVAAAKSVLQPRIPFKGGGTSHGARFTTSGALTSPNETLAGGANKLNLTVNVGDSRIDVVGTLPGATVLENAKLDLTAQGGNLNTPFSLLGVVIPDTRKFRVTSKVTPVGDEWRFTQINGRFGDSDLHGRMTIKMNADERLFIDADLNSNSLDILDAGPWIGYSPDRLDAMGGKGAITQEGGRPRVLPDAPLASESLGRFDAKVRFKAKAVRTGTIPISNLEIDLGLDKKLLTLKPVAFDIAGGRLTGDIDLNARKSPVITDYDIRLTPVRLGRLLQGFDIEDSGTTGTVKGRVQLRGYGDTVRESLGSSTGRIAMILPEGTFWIRNTELVELDIFQYVTKALAKQLKDPTEIRCGLLAFTVTKGNAAADPIFIDTQRSVIRGNGSFNFAQESLDLSIEADSKKFSLFSGQSPIGVGGYFAAPKINIISPELIKRGVAGVALGAVAAPIAAIVAFVDVGEEKDTNCGPILAGARTPAVRAADKAAEGKKTDAQKEAEKMAEERAEAQEKAAKKAKKDAEERAEKAREAAKK